MSLVAYGSSDESSEDEETVHVKNDVEGKTESTEQHVNSRSPVPISQRNTPSPIHESNNCESEIVDNVEASGTLLFNKLPQPKSTIAASEDVIEEDDDIPPKKAIEAIFEKPEKKDRAPVKITVPSLADFKDVDEENEKKKNTSMQSTKGTGLFALLPPPKGSTEVKAVKPLVPRVLSKVAEVPKNATKQTSNNAARRNLEEKSQETENRLGVSGYDSNSEDEDGPTSHSNKSRTTDFFSLTSTDTIADNIMDEDLLTKSVKAGDFRATLTGASFGSALKSDMEVDNTEKEYPANYSQESSSTVNASSTLVSNVMNLPKEEIVLKNKAEVGPKLPVPEQEYNIDAEGNVAFDDKAIEYLCGRRGVKRKEQVMDEANIIEISGEDIKPDEREWLVKALTEEPVQRPVSMLGGVNSQSKKKHQITYLAHQAKAMEMELKNQWAQNRMTRKQTQSKYGF